MYSCENSTRAKKSLQPKNYVMLNVERGAPVNNDQSKMARKMVLQKMTKCTILIKGEQGQDVSEMCSVRKPTKGCQ